MDSRIEELPIDEIVGEHDLRPRLEVNGQTVALYAEAMRAGAIFPPIRICDSTKRVIDGAHRLAAHRERGALTIKAQLESVTDDADFFLRAVAGNAAHGLNYNSFDYGRIGTRAEMLGITVDALSAVLKVDPIRLEDVRPLRVTEPPTKVPQARPHTPTAYSTRMPSIIPSETKKVIHKLRERNRKGGGEKEIARRFILETLNTVCDNLRYHAEWMDFADEIDAIAERLEREVLTGSRRRLILTGINETELQSKREREERDGWIAVEEPQYNEESDEFYLRMERPVPQSTTVS